MRNERSSSTGLRARYPALKISHCLLFIVLTVLLVPASRAHGLRLTHAKHLFDLTQNFRQPSDVAVSKDGNIFIADGVNNKIKVFSQSGKFLFSFGKGGAGNGEFNAPLGICVDDTGRVYVADSGNSRIQAFTSGGNYLGQIRLRLEGGTAPDPTDVAVDRSGKTLYAVDNDNHNIHVYSLATGKLTGIYGSPGEGAREFRYPFLISLDSEDYLYVVDVINTRVQVLNPEGLYVASIGRWGVEKGSFFRPKGVAHDNRDRIYVSDSYMGVIQVFDSMGEFHSAIGDPATNALRKFTTPTGIFIDNRNRLYVVEMFAEKVSVYQIEQDAE